MQPSTQAQTGWPAAAAGASSLSVLFHFNWQILRAGNRAAPTWFAWTSATGWFLWLISSNVGVLLCENCLHKHPDCSYRLKMKTNLSSVLFFFHSKWLRTASVYILSPSWSSSFSLSCSWSCLFLLVCAFHHCLSSIYFSLHISVSFPAVGGSIGSNKSVAEQLEEPSKP